MGVTVKARTFKAGWTESATATASYVVSNAAPTPTATPGAGVYDAGQAVSLSSPQPGFITYTLDGSEPSDSSTMYTGPFVLTEPAVVKARAYASGFSPSSTMVATYSIRDAQPTITPESGEFETLPTVSISSTSSEVSIHYTQDESTPTVSSPLYTGSFTPVQNTHVKAIATRPGWAPSLVAHHVYLTLASGDTGISSNVTLTSAAVSSGSFNAAGSTVTFAVSGGILTADRTAVYRNGVRLSGSSYSVASGQISIPAGLQEGRNEIEVEAIDGDDILLNHFVDAWAGSRTVSVSALLPAGSAMSGVSINVSLTGESEISETRLTNSNGLAVFSNIPAGHALSLTASASGYQTQLVELTAQSTSATFRMSIDNNDFSQGLAGWVLSTSRAWTADHSEASQPFVTCSDCDTRVVQSAARAGDETSAEAALTTTTDRDLMIDTKNLPGPQTVTRRFWASPGTKTVSVRYRFQTDEIFSAYRSSGVYKDDWYNVTLRSVDTGQQAQDVQTVSTLFASFDANAATPWRSVSLPVGASGENFEVMLTVSNAFDTAHMSVLQADVVEDRRYWLSRFWLNDLIDPNDPYAAERPDKRLAGLSATILHPDNVYDGFVRVHGGLWVLGPANDSIASVELVVRDGQGQVLTRGQLARSAVSNTARSALLGKSMSGANGLGIGVGVGEFGHELPATPLLFEISSAAIGMVNQETEDPDMSAEIEIRTALGVVLTRSVEGLPKFVRYTGTNRFVNSNRDLGLCSSLTDTHPEKWKRRPFPCGGDDWARPKVVQWVRSLTSMEWNDFSNMNGGLFPKHTGHRDGLTIDGRYPGYLLRNEQAGKDMVAFLNAYGAKIDRVLVTYTDKFMNGVREATVDGKLADGRSIARMIQHVIGHDRHFDVRVVLAELH